MERHNRSREKYIASYIMFAKSLQWRDGDDLAVDVDDDHVGGGWSPPEVDSGGISPPPIFSGSSLQSLCFWFCVSPLPPSGKRRGTIFRVDFRSRGCFRAKDRRKRGHEGQKRWAHAATVPGRMGHPLVPLRPPFACFFRS